MKKKMSNLELACYSFAERYNKTPAFGEQILCNLYNNGIFKLEEAHGLTIDKLSICVDMREHRTKLFMDHLNDVYEKIQKEKNHHEQNA